jgi:CheY-like chemotaxis protein
VDTTNGADRAAGPGLAGRIPARLALVIEDDHDVLQLLSAHVRRLGYAVAAASSGESGVALARSHQPDVVLVDLGLPGIDGWQVVRELKADARTTGCRIVISSVLDPHHFGDLPRHAVLPKPFSRRDVARALRVDEPAR